GGADAVLRPDAVRARGCCRPRRARRGHQGQGIRTSTTRRRLPLGRRPGAARRPSRSTHPRAPLGGRRGPRARRRPGAGPAPSSQPGVAWEWQWDAADMNAVPDSVQRAAGRVKIAVIDSGADVNAPDLADKAPETWSILSHSHGVRDVLGHGTFVSSLAAGS